MIPIILNNLNLHENDISGLNNKKVEDLIDENPAFNRKIKGLKEKYSCNLTLRKCSAKILDHFSNIWPKLIIENVKNFLEVELQNKDWVSK